MTTPAPQQFDEWLAGHVRGTLNDEATAGLADVVAAVHDLGAPGTLTVKLKVTPAGSGRRTVTIAGEVIAKPPVPDPELGLFYVGDGGSLHRDDPYASRMPGVPFRGTDGVARVVSPEDGEIHELDPDDAPPIDPPTS